VREYWFRELSSHPVFFLVVGGGPDVELSFFSYWCFYGLPSRLSLYLKGAQPPSLVLSGIQV